ncbi:Na+/H+ antiporter subunit E [Thioalkalivibrio denitrificans]|uniref:Na+/H+ antiporter subunit E n=1 Tax=Thioalkalivibrio denitrificans TaxID=108003 RepID=A0A1V3NRY3_9GAMM|nr:Na+/H+ antiporter subunit E [Thioalkalivibrio denitrificans]OOG27628.1 Na+/H+ antiporter subunit E [Thioalkalivibrio denitrificans]
MIALTWNIVLALIWVSLSGHFTAINLLIGFVLGYLILAYALRDLPVFANYARKGPRFVRFVGFFIKELVKSNLRVAHDVLTPTHHMRPAVIAFPLIAESDGEITILANLISLTPGTLSLDVSSDRKVLYIHVMYFDDEAEVHASIRYMETRMLEVLR